MMSMDKKGSFIHKEIGLMTMTSTYPLHSRGQLCFQGRGNVIKLTTTISKRGLSCQIGHLMMGTKVDKEVVH